MLASVITRSVIEILLSTFVLVMYTSIRHGPFLEDAGTNNWN